jgi:hypothetical protein
MNPRSKRGQEIAMASNFKSIVTFGIGFAGGWAARSLSDSPQGVGVKLMEIAISTKDRVGRWAAVERERLEDMLAEARSRTEPDVSEASGRKKKSGRSVHNVQPMNGQA